MKKKKFTLMILMERSYDVGETIGFVKTTIDFALKSDLKDELVPFLKDKLSELE